MCCLTVADSPSYKAATLFDTGAHASFVNREVAAWVEGHARRNPSYDVTGGDGVQQPDIRMCSLRFNFFNEVSRLHETVRNIQDQVIDSCIPVIVSRPIIRANHLVAKFLFTSTRGPALNPTRASQWCL